MKIFIAGDWHSDLHEKDVDQAFRKLGHDTERFSWHQYFEPEGILGRVLRPAYKAQNKFLKGPLVSRLNCELVAAVEHARPGVVFIYRGTHVFRGTLRHIREVCPSTVLLGYNNDDPFSPSYSRWMWRHFLGGIQEYDLVLAYRHHNVAEFLKKGARDVRLLRSWYSPERNRPVTLSKDEQRRFECDVVFAGHYEDDGRLQYLEQVVRRGWKLNLFGHAYGWHRALEKSPVLRKWIPLRTVWGEEYNKALCGARLALCFLSKLNRDTYTRRCFEIPASGALLLSEYSDDLASLFRAGVEADFFRSPTELIEKVDLYLGDDALRKEVACAGHQRVIRDGHDVVSRMKRVIEWVEEIQSDKRALTF